MAGWLTSTLPDAPVFIGSERIPLDSGLPNGQNPQTERVSLLALAAAMNLFANNSSRTTVSGTRYYSSFFVNAPSPPAADGGSTEAAPITTLTGIQLLVGSVGGTDSWIVELHDVNGVLLATSATAGTTAGTSGTWQQIPFTSTLSLSPGTYYLVVQSNGTTAHPAVYNFPAPAAATTPMITGSAAGSFGTGANFTPATTYTAGLGPVALPY